MRREHFERLVARAVASLPDGLREKIQNVQIVVEDRPSLRQLATAGVRRPLDLFGLYEGVPLTRRTTEYGFVLPDKISIFRRPIEAVCRSDSEVVREVRTTVIHEVAHHFGIDDDRLRELGWD